jgi:hypothetical protein
LRFFGASGLSGAFAIAEIWRVVYDGKRAERPIVTSNYNNRGREPCARDEGSRGGRC